MCFPHMRFSDFVGSRHTFEFYIIEEILGGTGREPGNIKDLAFCGVKFHVSVLFPLLAFTKVFLGDKLL